MIERDYNEIDYETLKKDDKFGRYKYLKNLENLITTKKDDCFVLQISGQYGSGKTFFINLLDKYLKNQGYETLYYNAWEHDYAQDAFVSFCSMFVSHFDDSTPDKEGFKVATKKLIISNLPTLLSFSCKALFGVDINKIVDTICSTAQDIDDNSQITKQACNDLLDAELERESIIQEFRDKLSMLVHEKNDEKQLIVFIDDLDRCKADFAIRLLDYIKHLFNIKGITFVLAVDDEQLKSTIENFYGAQNATGYLKRIIDFEFKLPTASYKEYINDLIEEYEVPGSRTYGDYFVNLLNNLAFMFDLSLRDLRNIFVQVHEVMKDKDGYKNLPYMYFVVYIMKHYYEKYKNEIAVLENQDSKKLSSSEKLVRFFNYKFMSSPYYTNSLFLDSPLISDNSRDYNLQEVMYYLIQLSNNNQRVDCYDTFPAHIAYTNNYDPYRKKTIYERILIDMDEARKEKSNQN